MIALFRALAKLYEIYLGNYVWSSAACESIGIYSVLRYCCYCTALCECICALRYKNYKLVHVVEVFMYEG